MADEQPNAFTRPGFLLSAGLLALIVVVGLAVVMVSGGKADPPALGTPPITAPPTEATPPDTSEQSICGLKGEVLGKARITKAPEVEWEFPGFMAMPVSDKYGPAATHEAGFQYCYQHSPEGALLAVSGMFAQLFGGKGSIAFTDHIFASDFPDREAAVATGENTAFPPSVAESDMQVAGFRLLSYDGELARIDLVLRVLDSGQRIYSAAIIDLVWERGDWRLSTTLDGQETALRQLPSLAGYISWGVDQL